MSLAGMGFYIEILTVVRTKFLSVAYV